MKTNRLQKSLLYLAGIAPLFIGAGLAAAPLTWFPGPSLDWPVSGAATVVLPGFGNVLIGGDALYSPYAEGLVATNIYWTPLTQPLYGIYNAPGAVADGGQIVLYGGNDGTSSSSTVISYSPSDGAPGSTFTFTDTNASQFPVRFYRVVSP